MFHKNKSKRFYETYVFYFLISNFCNKLFKSSQVGTVECNLLYIITSLCIYINQLFQIGRHNQPICHLHGPKAAKMTGKFSWKNCKS